MIQKKYPCELSYNTLFDNSRLIKHRLREETVNKNVKSSIDLAFAWCGPAYVLLLLVGWWGIAGYLPLHRPSAGVDEIYDFYSQNQTGIRIGMLMIMIGAAAFIPMVAVIAKSIRRIEGETGPAQHDIPDGRFTPNAMLTFYPPIWWMIAIFRERSPEVVYLLKRYRLAAVYWRGDNPVANVHRFWQSQS